MTLSVLRGRLALCRLEPDAAIPVWATRGRFWSVTRTSDELSVICDERTVPSDVKSKGGWRALKLHGPFDFSAIGVLRPIVDVLAHAEISILATATFDTDYVLVSEDSLASACDVLRAAGYTLLEDHGS